MALGVDVALLDQLSSDPSSPIEGTVWYNITAQKVRARISGVTVDLNVALTASAPANVTSAAAVVGAATDSARADHKHDVSVAAPGATGVATASGAGAASTLARSDHTHQSNTAPANVTKAAAVIGTSGEPARADHKHDVTTAAATAVGTANAEGAATSLARSDHTHQVTGLVIASQVQGDILYFNGTSWVRLAPGTSGHFLKTLGGAANPLWDAAGGGTNTNVHRFAVTGKIAVATKVDSALIIPRAGTITRVTLYRRTAGTSGSTTVDVNKNGTTIYTTQGNRPSVAFGAGADALSTTTPDVTAVAQNDRIEIDVDVAEGGNSLDLALMIEIQPS